MKMKYLVLGASCLALGAAHGETAKFGSVVGYWQFNESPYMADSSGFGNDLSTFNSGVSGGGTEAADGCYNASPCLTIGTKGATAAGSLRSGVDMTKGFTAAILFRNGGDTVSVLGDSEIKKALSTINDKDHWHFAAWRYDPDKKANSGHTDMLFTDPTYGDRHGRGSDAATDGTRAEVSGDDDPFLFPLSVNGTTVSIGGKVGYNKSNLFLTYNVAYKGKIDDAVLLNRVLTKQELTRMYHSGETFVYSLDNVAFSSAVNWSSNEGSLAYKPSDIPGADFIVDNGCSVAADAACFGGGSLTLGRLTALKSRVDGTLMATEGGNFDQSVTSVTVGDLRLNCGKITGTAGRTLAATKLTVNATAESPFEVNVDSGAYAISGAATGDGTLKKTGEGTLDLTGLTGAARVVVAEGKVLAGPNVTVAYDLVEDRGAVPVLMVE